MTTVTTKIHFRRQERRKRVVSGPAAMDRVPEGRTPRISKMMALAIHFDGMIRDGLVRDQRDLAALAMVSQPR